MSTNRETLAAELFNKQLEILGKTRMEVVDDDKWRKWQMSAEDFDAYQKWAISLIKKVLKCNTKKAQMVFDWFYSMFGVKIKS